MPIYIKFLKEILSKKRKLEEHEIVAMIATTSMVIQSMPPKMKDSGKFSILCQLGIMNFDRELCDLGASVGLIPPSV